MSELTTNELPDVGTLVTHPKFGLGKVVHQDAKRVHIFFRDDSATAARRFPSPAPVTVSESQSDPILDNTPPFTKVGNEWRIPGEKRVVFNFAIERFKTRYPLGFDDPAYLGLGDPELNERGYKWAAHEAFVAELGNGKLRQLVESGAPEELAQLLTRLMINLPSQYEKMALVDGLKDRDAALRFADSLDGLLESASEETFAGFLDALGALPVEPTKSSPFKWTNATYYTYIAQPDRHMFFKPTPTKLAAEAFGFDLRYDPTPSWQGYQRLLEFANIYLDRLRPYGAKDYIDVQSFLWLSPQL